MNIRLNLPVNFLKDPNAHIMCRVSIQPSYSSRQSNMADKTQHLHVAVFAFPFGSHAGPLLSLVRRLSAANPTIKFSFLSTEESNNLNFSSPELLKQFPNVKPYNVFDGMPEGHELSDNPLEAIGFFLEAAPKSFKLAVEETEADAGVKVSCLFTDAFFVFAGDLAEEMKVPWVVFWVSAASPLSIHLHTDLIRSKLGNTSTATAENEDQTLKFIPGLSAIHKKDLQEGILLENLGIPIFAEMLHKMALNLPKATAVVVNSVEELEPSVTNDLKSKLQKLLLVGPLTIYSLAPSTSDETGCLSWLDKQKAASVAYISFGAVAALTPTEMVAMAETLQSRKIPFLWTVRGHARHLLPQGFIENTEAFGKVVTWSPQLRVLAHPSVGVFVTQCGWNSIQESMAGGVPMICRPFFAEQWVNGRLVEDVWQVGVGVDGGLFSESGLISAFESVLMGQAGEKMRQNILLQKQYVLDAVGPHGSSTANFKILLEVIETRKQL